MRRLARHRRTGDHRHRHALGALALDPFEARQTALRNRHMDDDLVANDHPLDDLARFGAASDVTPSQADRLTISAVREAGKTIGGEHSRPRVEHAMNFPGLRKGAPLLEPSR